MDKNSEHLPSRRLSSFSDHKRVVESRNYNGSERVNSVAYMNTKSPNYSPVYSDGIMIEDVKSKDKFWPNWISKFKMNNA